jgi:hypothetical protein
MGFYEVSMDWLLPLLAVCAMWARAFIQTFVLRHDICLGLWDEDTVGMCRNGRACSCLLFIAGSVSLDIHKRDVSITGWRGVRIDRWLQ